MTCKHPYTGEPALRLARTLWGYVATREEADPERLLAANELAVQLDHQGEFSEAARIHRETLEVRRRVLGLEHPGTLASAGSLANVLAKQGEFSEAARIFRETLEVSRRVLGLEHPDTLMSANNLANVLKEQGEFSEAARTPPRDARGV